MEVDRRLTRKEYEEEYGSSAGAIIHSLTQANARLTTALTAAQTRVRTLHHQVLKIELQGQMFCTGKACAVAAQAEAARKTAVAGAAAAEYNARQTAEEAQAAARRAGKACAAAQARAQAAERGQKILLQEIEELRRDLDAYRVLSSAIREDAEERGEGGKTGEDVLVGIVKENKELRSQNAQLESQCLRLADQVADMTQKAKDLAFQTMAGKQPVAAPQELVDAADRVPGLEAELARREEEVAALTDQNRGLKIQLAAFDPEFFAQLDALKETHERALALLHQYRRWLLISSRRYGISYPDALMAPPPAFALPVVKDAVPVAKPPRSTLSVTPRTRTKTLHSWTTDVHP